MRRIEVVLPGKGYEVVVGAGLLSAIEEILPVLPKAEKAFVVSDRVVGDLYFAELSEGLQRAGLSPVHLWVPQGEEAKTLQSVDALYRQLAVQEAHRDDVIVALGGGAVGDLGGFLAATYMRGMPVVQVSTTLTGQVDASIGGKTAVNLPEGKNLVGSFHQPVAVIADVVTLASLTDRDFRSGMAEVAKYGLTLDLELLAMLESDLGPILARDAGVMEELVTRCATAKAGIVSVDERDSGERLFLNYGHTLGHALERLEAFAGRSHGEAIAAGMVFAARLSEVLGMSKEGLVARTVRLLNSVGLDVTGPLPVAEEIMEAFKLDKKYHGGVRFVLLAEVGNPRVVEGVSDDVVMEQLKEMGA